MFRKLEGNNNKEGDNCSVIFSHSSSSSSYSLHVPAFACVSVADGVVCCDFGSCSNAIKDFGFDEYEFCDTNVVDTTVGDLRGNGSTAIVPYSHTPMGSTTKLVTNSDDSPKVYMLKIRNAKKNFSRPINMLY